MKKILVVFGTRPEAIKMAPVIQEIKKFSELTSVECVTGQHREMLDQVLKVFHITPQYDLNIMSNGQDLFDITAKSLLGLKEIYQQESPDAVMVQGDTTTSFIAGLAAYYFKLPIFHIEAGLRTYNKYSPFPEEKNRHLLSVLADLHFAPTKWAKSNLLKERIPEERIWVTGNTVVDSLLSVIKSQKSEDKEHKLERYFQEKWKLPLKDVISGGPKLILVTGHRRENFGKGFENICKALSEIGEKRRDVRIVYPVHLNPNVRYSVNEFIKEQNNIHLIEPLEYEQFVFLMKRAYMVLTDSGGIQEEAPALGKPVFVLRDTTERPEGIEAGTVKLVGTSKENIVREVQNLLDNKEVYEKMSKANNPYGDGKAAQRIVTILRNTFFGRNNEDWVPGLELETGRGENRMVGQERTKGENREKIGGIGA